MDPTVPMMPKMQHSLRWVDLARLSIRNFSAKPSRTILTVLGTSVGIATVVILVSLGYGLQNILMGKLITTPESLVTLSASYPTDSNLTIDENTVNEISKVPDVKMVSPVAEFPGSIQMGSISGLVVIHIVDDNYTTLSGNLPDSGIGVGLAKEPGVVISNQVSRLLNLPAGASPLGKMISVSVFYPVAGGQSTRTVSASEELPIIGVESIDATPTVIIPREALPEPPPSYSEIYAEAQNDTVLNDLRSAITNKGFIISAHIDLVRQAQQVTNIITIILAVFGIAALLVSAIGMFNTMIIGFLERTYEVGIMKALGATDSDVRRLFLTESIIMGLMGGLIGILIGAGLGWLFNFVVSAFATHFGGEKFALFVSPIWFLLFVIGVSAAIGLVAGFIPARRASLLSPKEAFLRK